MGALAKEGVSLISNRDVPAPDRICEPWGLCEVREDGFRALASPYWHWGNVYTNLVRGILSGGWESLAAPEGQAVNYWWGMNIRAVDILFTAAFPNMRTCCPWPAPSPGFRASTGTPFPRRRRTRSCEAAVTVG